MSIAVKRYTSTMTNSPTLNGVAGSLVALLDACLKDGFNAKTVSSATQAGGTATITTSAAHGYAVNDVVVLSGANESAWNSEFRVLTVAPNNFTVAIDSGAAATATGTMSVKIAPLGWTMPFSGTNKAAYLPQSQFTQCLLRVLDDSTVPTSANGRWAKLRGYESMTDVDKGSGLYPTAAQLTNGLSVIKSIASDSSARAWWLVGDGGIFYMGIFWANTTLAGCIMFGDPSSLKSGDGYCSVLTGYATDELPANVGDWNLFGNLGAYNATQVGKYMARNYSQIGGSIPFGMIGDGSVSTTMGIDGFAFPNPIDNGLLYAPVGIVEASGLRVRAMPGIYQPLHNTPLNYLDTVTDLPDLPGRTLQAMDVAVAYWRGQALFDIIGPWR